jgi:2-C-methyl-D-erythritol 4-phosphate cytidylyltransferase/2-C-methyl-D-erythritol 2,4-cyclodiphosphate synthase
MTEEIAVLIVAAGQGVRAGGDVPKQYQSLGVCSVLEHSILAFQKHPNVSDIQVVIHRDHIAHYSALSLIKTLNPPVVGGATRQESVSLGLAALKEQNPKYVLIHDAARPFVSHAVIDRVIKGLQSHEAVVPVVAMVDTIKQMEGDTIVSTLDRSLLKAVQTPQGFCYEMICDLHMQYVVESLTDDAALAEKAKIIVYGVEGDMDNFKITTSADIESARIKIGVSMDIRTGMGFDAHRLIEHDKDASLSQKNLKICGVSIPFEKTLEGHSDADVGYHALVDALLGSVGAGDIGLHFPPADPKWRGADSARFVLHAQKILMDKNATLLNVDVTIICERPKITPHRNAMVENIAKLLHIDSTRVNIKSTTTERMGFTGRGEGIAAQAVATVRIG